jgi:hypothetical protein
LGADVAVAGRRGGEAGEHCGGAENRRRQANGGRGCRGAPCDSSNRGRGSIFKFYQHSCHNDACSRCLSTAATANVVILVILVVLVVLVVIVIVNVILIVVVRAPASTCESRRRTGSPPCHRSQANYFEEKCQYQRRDDSNEEERGGLR